jgi:hypothetical protein
MAVGSEHGAVHLGVTAEGLEDAVAELVRLAGRDGLR